jgi:hypothetical protein
MGVASSPPILTLLCHFSHGFGAHSIDNSPSGPPDRECAARVRGPADFGAQFPLHLALFQGEDVKPRGQSFWRTGETLLSSPASGGM